MAIDAELRQVAETQDRVTWRERLGGLRPGGPQRAAIQEREGLFGWLFVSPALLGLLVFLFLPVVFTLWVSFRDWNGISPPFRSDWVGLENYQELLTEAGVRRTDLFIAVRNNLYYVLGVVPTQTVLAFVLAVIVNLRYLKGKGFFRTAYYFPSITSSVAISLIFLFLFQVNGAINAVLPFKDINWVTNARGVIHNVLGMVGVDGPSPFMADTRVMGLSLWEWIAGPSVAMSAIMLLNIWTTTGTFMLIFLAALQNISPDVEEAALVDGASAFQVFRFITVPLMKPAIFFVVTLGLIGTWQVFDQIFVITFGGPQKTTLTPAFLIYLHAFQNSRAGLAGALSLLLFLIIMAFTILQRRLLGETTEV